MQTPTSNASLQLLTLSIKGTAAISLITLAPRGPAALAPVTVSAEHVPDSFRGTLTTTRPLLGLGHRQVLLWRRLLVLLRLSIGLLLLAVALSLALGLGLARGPRVVTRRIRRVRSGTAIAAATRWAVAARTTLGVVGRRTLGGVWWDARRRGRAVDAISVLDVRHPAGL